MKLIDKLSLATALLALAGCAITPDVRNPGDSSAQLNSAQTFALIPVGVVPEVPPSTARAVIEAAQAGARDSLRALGYSETSRDQADLVFYLHGKSMAPVAVGDLGYLPAPSKFGMEPAEMAASANRRVFVETYDNHSKRQIWLGSVECSCQGVHPKRIQHEIERIVAGFPPRSKT